MSGRFRCLGQGPRRLGAKAPEKRAQMDLGLKGKVAVVSGGSVGIGLSVAHALAEEGVHVVLCARNEARVVEKAKEVAARHGVRALGIGADVSEASGVDKVLAATEETFG